MGWAPGPGPGPGPGFGPGYGPMDPSARLANALAQARAQGIGPPEVSKGLTRKILIILGLHLALATAIRFAPILGVAHAGFVVLFGAMAALSNRPHAAVYAMAYIAGSEVLWRMCQSPVFWESGKYAIILIAGLGILRTVKGRPAAAPILYVLLAVPSVFISYIEPSRTPFRVHFGNYCAGPLALAATGLFVHAIRFNKSQTENLLISLLGPIAGIASICFFTTVSDDSIVFDTESNFKTSGGFGPNQVSSVVGLGVLSALLLVLRGGVVFSGKIVLLGLALFMAAISALTFSRSGVVIAAITLMAVTPFLARSGKNIANYLFAASVIVAVCNFLLIPVLESFTGGKIGERFRERGMTNRETLMWGDVELFLNYPLFGVGMGHSQDKRPTKAGFTHSEVTRMLAEQGVFGAAGLLTLIVAGAGNVRKTHKPEDRIITVAFIVWGSLFMFSNAMRIVSPMLLIGLAFTNFGDDRRFRT